MTGEPEAGKPQQEPKPKRSRRRKWLLRLMFVLYAAVVLEIGCRLYWVINNDVPFFRPSHVIYRFYPHLRDTGVQEADVRPGDGHLDVLILSGSVLEDRWGTVEKHLREKLRARTQTSVRTFNLARRGHTSRDSLLKYRRVGAKPFDLVVLYHGINEVRFNNCPASMFRDDYTHVAWYVKINRLRAHRRLLPILTFPYTLEYTALHVLENRRFEFYLTKHDPKPQWVALGKDIKTDRTLGMNFQEVLRMTRRRNQPVLLMTFALHLPEDYTPEKFRQKALAYSMHRSWIETWGSPENVAAAVAAHNEVVRRLAAEYDHALLVDQDRLMPRQAEYFDDCCHFTDAGSRRFVANVIEPICRLLGPGRRRPATAPRK